MAENAERALELMSSFSPAVVVTDVRMAGIGGLKLLESIKRLNPALPVVMMTAYGSIPDAVEAMRQGAYDYVTKPFTADHILRVVARALEVQELRAENRELREKIESLIEPEPFLTYSPHSRKLAETARQVADSDATALITGESGTGKSMLASYIHRLSPRKAGPFVQVACTTLSEHLLESELFGHVRGAFTGSIKDKPGRLEAAEGGTVFLDEIGDLSLELQSKLLRFLQEKTFERVGGSETLKIDARILAATNQELEQLVSEKRFREDLYYRLNVIELKVPPLRERPGEIVPLAENFLEQFAALHRKPAMRLDEQARTALLSYRWPGNIRELRNVTERAVILSRGQDLTMSDLPDKVLEHPGLAEKSSTLEELERRHIKAGAGC